MSQAEDFFSRRRLIAQLVQVMRDFLTTCSGWSTTCTYVRNNSVGVRRPQPLLSRDRSRSTNRNVSKLQDQFKYLRGLANSDAGKNYQAARTSRAGEKSSLVGYKRTPCSTPSLSPSSGSFPALQAGSGTTLQNR